MAEHSGLNGFLVATVTWWPLHTWSWRYLFADLALATSFLGERLACLTIWRICSQRRNTVAGRLQTGAMTFRRRWPLRVFTRAGL